MRKEKTKQQHIKLSRIVRYRLPMALLLSMTMIVGCGASAGDGQTSSAEQAEAEAGDQTGDDVNAATDEGTGTDAAADAGADNGSDAADGTETNDVPSVINAEKDGFMLPETTMLTSELLNLKYQFAKEDFGVKWTSPDESIVKVGPKGSLIKAMRVGHVTLEGISSDGKHRFQCDITVEKKPKNIIYLTFDDGPSRYSTPKILDILKKNAVHATFFELKPAKADYDLTQRVIDEGHTLAIHGYQHKYDQIYKSDLAYHKNLVKLQRLFYRQFGQWCTQTRFPGGSSNTISRHYSVGIMSRLVKKVHRWGFLYQDWNVSSGDAGGSNTPDEVFRMVTSGIQKGRSNVVLMHDFSGNDKTINALQRIIDWGKQHNFVFRGMSPSTVEIHHGVNN